ncbi:MAG TPA: WhiB family transcriptional regulator [Acidimicrobiales bacterium]
MALAWQSVDTRYDPDETLFAGDPQVLVDAFGELLELLDRRPSWQRQAACRGEDPELWFPGRGASTSEAKSICAECPVADECKATGLQEKHGIWGGLSERQRRQERSTAA